MDTRKSQHASTSFEIERARLLREAAQGLDQLTVNLNHLNRNLATLNAIAVGFKEPSNLWHNFHSALKPENDQPMDTRE